jgi:imidazolonepropionase-like amidohydrolase
MVDSRSRLVRFGMVFAASAGLTACACAIAATNASPAIAIADVSIVDVEHGRLADPATVLVVDGRIKAIGAPEKIAIPDGAERIDGHGRFLMPGLVDMHVHLFAIPSHRPPATWSFPLYVANGVTSVREMAAAPESIALVNQWRTDRASGALIVPRVAAAGVITAGPSPEEAVRQVDAAADAGADFIKVFSEIAESSWRAALDEARRRALPLMGHVPAGVSAVAAAKAGQRSEEHLMQVFEDCSTAGAAAIADRHGLAGAALVARRDADEPRVLGAYDEKTCETAAKALAATGTVEVPTLVLDEIESRPNYMAFPEDPRWRYLREDERARWLRATKALPADHQVAAARRRAVARKIVAVLHRARVPIFAGTDSPMPNVYPGYALHDELEQLVASGLSPADALRSATIAPARFLPALRDSGVVAVGKRADLVLLEADPLADIGNTRRIDAVVLDGRLLRRADLDALLADAARRNAPKSNDQTASSAKIDRPIEPHANGH